MSNVNQRHIDVLIEPNANEPHGIKFSMPNGDLVFHNNGKHGFMVYFNILDPHNTGYRFPDDLREALWVKEIKPDSPETCPDEHTFWPQFKAKEVMNSNKTLRVRNLNEDEQRFGFTLRVTKNPAQNGPCIPYDPIGDNQNGNFKFVSIGSAAAAAIGGAAIGATVSVLTSQAATSQNLATGAAIGGLLGVGVLFLFGRVGTPKEA